MQVQKQIDKYINAFEKISIQEFVEISNFNSKTGFYNIEEKNKIGPKGHFITSPEISSIFGEAIFNKFIKKNKNISKIHLLELGPGNGLLMQDMLNNFKSNNIEILSLTLVEKSEYFKEKLFEFSHINNFSIINDINDLNFNDDDFVFIYSNEFFDAFSHKQFIFENNEFAEIIITKKNNKYYLSKLQSILSDFIIAEYDMQNLLKGDIIEYSSQIDYFIQILRKKINKFYFTTIDYGYEKIPKISTLRAIKNNKKINLFDDFENVDYSFSVDFNRLKKNFFPLQSSLISQSELLTKYVPEYFLNNKNEDKKIITNLLSGSESNEMGKAFKNFTVYNYD